jgi:two-component system, chemotaxis family, CheB/CheR fusion protein
LNQKTGLTPSPSHSNQPENDFYIVGIGASAGGLSAFESLFRNIPADAGLAYVVIQHLGKDQRSILPEIIQRYTKMAVKQVRDGIQVEPDNVYVIPPGSQLALKDGHLFLMKPEEGIGQRLPIDRFFRSLAQVQGPKAIGIVLSGTLSDGSQGISYIKEEQGLTIAQDPETAEYDGMPRSAIATNDIDFVLAPEKIGEVIQKYLQHQPLSEYTRLTKTTAVREEALQQIFFLVRSNTGHNFAQYKKDMVMRRIGRRLRVCMVNDLNEYLEFIYQHPQEIEALVKELLINVTHFFRDPNAFEALNHKSIYPLIQQKCSNHEPLRVWVPGCSSGEEAYTLAILIDEHIERQKVDCQVQLFATDIDEDSIAFARKGLYPDGSVENVSGERLRRYFHKEDSGYQITKKIRDIVIFSNQNAISDPPFSRIDLLCCRNLLIYLETDLQKHVLQRFYYGLNPGGYLFLGSSESTGRATDLFQVLDRKHKIYQRGSMPSSDQAHMPSDLLRPKKTLYPTIDPVQKRLKSSSLREWVEKELLNSHTPACVITDLKHNLLYVHGRTGKYLELRSGETNSNLILMAREGLKTHLATALHSAAVSQETVQQTGIQVKTNGGYQSINLTIKPFKDANNQPNLFMVLFDDQSLQPNHGGQSDHESPVDQRVAHLERSLSEKDEYLNTIIDELESANQDLKSANEELQSYNEEIQSANEELETSKEELQSVNEELTTINTELQNKNEELSRINNDIHNLLDSTEIATLLLDLDLQIRRYTPPMQKICSLLPTDIGRPVNHLHLRLRYPNFTKDVQAVIDTLESKKIEIESQDGMYYLIHIKPYRTVERIVDGAVVTFVDITEQKHSEELRRLAAILRDSNDAITMQSMQGDFLAWNRGATQMYGWSEAEALQMTILDLTPEYKHEETIELYQRIGRGEVIRSFETQRIRRDGQLIDVWLTLTALTDDRQNTIAVATTERDITERNLKQHYLRLEKRSLLALSQWYQNLLEHEDKSGRVEQACQILVDEAGYSLAWVGRIDQNTGSRIIPIAWAGFDGEEGAKNAVEALIDKDQKLIRNALRKKQPMTCKEEAAGQNMGKKDAVHTTCLVLPLIDQTIIVGVLSLYDAEQEAFAEQELQHLATLSYSLAKFIEEGGNK